MTTAIKWNSTSEEWEIIVRIADRVETLARKLGVKYDRMQALMDITAVHANGNPLRLQELLDADDGNFGHDVFGIRRYLDRNTGKLTDCFVPRFTRAN